MDPNRETVNKALALIEAVDLPHPFGSLLSSFVLDALNPTLAARYITERLSNGDALPAVQDWAYIIHSIQNGSAPPHPDAATQREIRRRDGGRCCVTGKTGTLWDPLIIKPVLPVPRGWTTEPSVIDMLGAFFGTPYRDWWLDYASDPEYMPFHNNHWLVRKSAAEAFAQGLVWLDRLQPSMLEFKVNCSVIMMNQPIKINGYFPLLGDHSRHGLQKVDARFVGSHARLSKGMQYLHIAKIVAPEILPPVLRPSLDVPEVPKLAPERRITTWRPFRTIGQGIFRAFFSVWLMFPSSIRQRGYGLLWRLGGLLYRDPIYGAIVQKVPFGLYLKYSGDPEGSRNEFNALQLVHRYTSIPAPVPLDVALRQDPTESSPHGAYLFMTEVPGKPLAQSHVLMSDEDSASISKQMTQHLHQLRRIPGPANAATPISNTLGEACRDTRIRGASPMGPFANEEAFNQILRYSDHPGRQGHNIVFTHADLNPRNILVGPVAQPDGRVRWEVTGIVDWENSGYLPEYWDCTKAMFEHFRWSTRYNKLARSFFKDFGGYETELEVETMAWESGDAV